METSSAMQSADLCVFNRHLESIWIVFEYKAEYANCLHYVSIDFYRSIHTFMCVCVQYNVYTVVIMYVAHSFVFGFELLLLLLL